MLQRLLSALHRFSEGIFRIAYVFSVFGFSVLLVLLFTNVVSRNLFGNSFDWIDELTKFIFTWMMFIGVVMSVYKKRQIGMEFVTAKLPLKIKTRVEIFCTGTMMAFFFVLTLYGIKYSLATLEMFSPVMNISYGLVYLCIPVCGIPCMLFGVLDLFEGKHPEQKPAGEGN